MAGLRVASRGAVTKSAVGGQRGMGTGSERVSAEGIRAISSGVKAAGSIASVEAARPRTGAEITAAVTAAAEVSATEPTATEVATAESTSAKIAAMKTAAAEASATVKTAASAGCGILGLTNHDRNDRNDDRDSFQHHELLILSSHANRRGS